MIILYFISMGLFLAYVLTECIRYNIPKSISESSYLWGPKDELTWLKKWKKPQTGAYIFWGWMTLFILPMLVYWLDITTGTNNQFLIFISCAALCFVGITGRYRSGDKTETLIHEGGTVLCAVLSQIWAIMTFSGFWVITLASFAVAIGLGLIIRGTQRNLEYGALERKQNSLVFWVEVALFAMAFYSIHLFQALAPF
jgi:hypothetical protein